MKQKKFQPNKILSYFREEWKVLLIVTISGLIYNLGLLAGPWFEGQMTECLVNILNGFRHYPDMMKLAIGYVLIIGIVQISRYIKQMDQVIWMEDGQTLIPPLILAGIVDKITAGTGASFPFILLYVRSSVFWQ